MNCKSFGAILLALAFLAIFSAQAQTQPPRIRLSKETTAITEPLLPNGLPDYVTAINTRYGKDVTPDNNGFILWLQLMPEAPSNGTKLGPRAQARFEELLGVKLAPGGPKLQGYSDNLRTAGKQVWTEKDNPKLAAYLREMKPALDILETAAAKQHWWCPAVENDDGNLVLANPGYYPLLQATDAFIARAMLRFGAGDVDGFLADFVTARRLAAHIASEAGNSERFRGHAQAMLANQAAGIALASGKFTLAQCQALARAMDALPPPGTIAEAADVAERYSVLRAICRIATIPEGQPLPRITFWSSGSTTVSSEDEWKRLESIDRGAVDWNLVLTRMNAKCEDEAAAARLPRFSELQGFRARQMREFGRYQAELTAATDLHKRSEESTADYSERVARGLMNRILASAIMEWSARPVDMHEPMLRALLAAATFKAKTGDWPDTLNQLVPNYLPAIGKDIYSPNSDAPLSYIVSASGPRVYSIGPDGKDDYGQLVPAKKKDDPHVGAEEIDLPPP